LKFLYRNPLLLLTLTLSVFSVYVNASSALQIKDLQSSKQIAVLSPQGAMAHIRKARRKPLVVLFSSLDASCRTCAKANHSFYRLSQKEHSNFNFAFVNTKPWGARELEATLFYRLSSKHPVTLIMHHKKVLRKLVGDNYQNMPRYLKEVKKIISARRLPMYGDKLANASFNAVVISDQYSAFLSKYFNNKKHYKAIAVALGKRNKWTASQKVGYLTQAAANYQALKQCSQRWQARGNKGECQLYMMGDEYVYKKSDAEVKQLIASMPKMPTPLDHYVTKLKHLNGNKALAYAVNDAGNWTSSYVSSHRSERSATASVLESCEKRRLKKSINGPCRLYFVNDKFIDKI